MANEPRTIKGPCFDECLRGINWTDKNKRNRENEDER